MLKNAKNLLWAICIAFVVVGCNSVDQGEGDDKNPPPMDEVNTSEVAATPGEWDNNATDKSLGESPLGDLTVIPDLNFPTIYFPYDSNNIVASEAKKLDKVADYLNKYDLYLIVEGHCDQRGTEEYNRSLGERRANIIRDYLVKANVNAAKIRTISYGKDKPAVEGNNEDAWGKNRRGMLLPARKKAQE